MAKINKKDSKRMVNHIRAAWEIIQKAEEKGGPVTMDPDCAAEIMGMLASIEGTAFDSAEG